MGVLFVLAIFRNPLNQRRSFTEFCKSRMLPAAAASKCIWMKRRNMLTDNLELCKKNFTNHFRFQFEIIVISLENVFQCVSDH